MNGVKCQRCGNYWSFSGNPNLFQVIDKFCPICIPAVLPRLGVVAPMRKPQLTRKPA
ncbi:hypothetical protein I5J49_gp50 [Mycobacterium phage ThulaThula]|uniref:Uncharacterized protein n=1 Tax=Mycobacterium phage ThulaThula TaxID=2599880 RepID=A0A5J6TF61_9CAUD|nr:hypothetical protein I5J49_gp50 [Mycobacterium phage ThulaThula]QFG09078.1 hypothetical protein PBI_THULATHULA_50 [Mycobacterium phage ThulaThula]